MSGNKLSIIHHEHDFFLLLTDEICKCQNVHVFYILSGDEFCLRRDFYVFMTPLALP
jgi:hypothetical protein